jgi:hypothetical protein
MLPQDILGMFIYRGNPKIKTVKDRAKRKNTLKKFNKKSLFYLTTKPT